MSTDTPSSSSAASASHYPDIPGERLSHVRVSSPHYAKPLIIEQLYIEASRSLHPIPQLTHHLFSVLLRGDAEGYYRPNTSTHAQTVSLAEGDAFMLDVSSQGQWGWQTSGLHLLFVHLPPTMVHRVAASHHLNDGHTRLHSTVWYGDRVLHLLGQSLAPVVDEGPPATDQHPVAHSIAQVLTLRGLLKRPRAQDAPLLLDEAQGPLSAPARRRIQTYIRTHLDRRITVADVADCVDLSPAYFSRLFKATVGETPYQYILRERVHKAQRLLVETDFSIAEIALRVGFSNQSHLTRRFRKVTHTTPAAYRRAVALDEQPMEEESD